MTLVTRTHTHTLGRMRGRSGPDYTHTHSLDRECSVILRLYGNKRVYTFRYRFGLEHRREESEEDGRGVKNVIFIGYSLKYGWVRRHVGGLGFRSREVQALTLSDTHSCSVLSVSSHTLTRGHTQSLSGAGSPLGWWWCRPSGLQSY